MAIYHLNKDQRDLFIDIYKTVLHAELSKSNYSDTVFDENYSINAAARIALYTVDLLYKDGGFELETVEGICDKLNNRPIDEMINLPDFKDE